MRIVVIAPSALPSRRANAIQTVQMAQAFARLGHEVLLLAYPSPPAPLPEEEGRMPSPRASLPEGEGRSLHPQLLSRGERGADWEGLAAEYGLKARFAVRWLRAQGWARRYDFSLQAVWAAQRWGAECLLTRLPQAAAGASLCGIPTIFEVHDLLRGGAAWLFRLFLLGRGAKRVVAISNALATDLMESFPSLRRFQQGFLVVAPDGVDLQRYTPLLSPAEARQCLREKGWALPDGFIAGYTGHLYSGRGAELLVALAAAVPEAHFLIVGGKAESWRRLERQFKERRLVNYTLTGWVAPWQVPLFQMASDVLLMPYQTRVAASSGGNIARYLSPLKLFEYLASGRPILASDLAVLREVLNESNAILLPVGEEKAWAEALRCLLHDPRRFRELAEGARQTAEHYSWESRAASILAD